jgi:hypothetical protein
MILSKFIFISFFGDIIEYQIDLVQYLTEKVIVI